MTHLHCRDEQGSPHPPQPATLGARKLRTVPTLSATLAFLCVTGRKFQDSILVTAHLTVTHVQLSACTY